MENLFDLFCSTCEATDLHKHRSALYEWLNDVWSNRNAVWYGELERIALQAFTEYCKTLSNPSILALIGVTHVADNIQETDESVLAAIERSMMDATAPAPLSMDFDEEELAEAIRRSMETDLER